MSPTISYSGIPLSLTHFQRSINFGNNAGHLLPHVITLEGCFNLHLLDMVDQRQQDELIWSVTSLLQTVEV